MGTLVLAPLTCQAQAQEAMRTWNIPAGPLENALADFAAESGINLTFEPELVAARRSPGVSGSHSIDDALTKLLASTGLTADRGVTGAYVLRELPDRPASVMRAIKVEATEDPRTTDGTGLYSTEQASSATRLRLSLRETPQSMTVVTRQQLDDLGVTSLNEALDHITGIYTTNSDTERTQVYSRGYQINNYQVDGLSTVQSSGYIRLNHDSAIFDRVEVVRGATGLVTGAGDPGGIVGMWRKRPGESFRASVTGLLGRWDNRRAELDVGGPIAFDGRLRARAVAVKQETESFRDQYELNKSVLYGIVEASLTEHTTLAIGYDYEDPETTGVTWGTVPYWMADGSLANMPRSTSYSPPWSSWPIEQRQAFATLDHDFGNGWTVKAAYTDDRKEGRGKIWYGGDGYPAANGTGMGGWYGTNYFRGDNTTVDVNVNGFFSLFGREHQIALGYSELQGELQSPRTARTDPYPNYAVIPDWRNWNPNIPQFDVVVRDFNSSDSRTVQKGAFLALRLQVADPLKVLLGSRISDYDQRSRNYSAVDGSLTSASGYDVSGEITPYVGAIYDITPTISAYASYADIFQPQNYRDVNNDFIDPIVGDMIEAGLKAEFFDKRLLVAAAIFGGRQDNLAEPDTSRDLAGGGFDPQNPPAGFDEDGHWLLPDGSVPYKSTGKGNEVRGYELDLQGSITERWNVSFGFSHTKIEDAKGAGIRTDVPEDLVRAFTTYRLRGVLSGLTIGGGVTWQSDIWRTASKPTGAYNPNGTAVTGAARIEQGSYALVSAMARYEFGERLSASFNVNNLFDKHYYRQVGFYNGVHWGEPLNWTLRLQYGF